MAKEDDNLKVPDYTENLNKFLESADSVLQDFKMYDSIQVDQEFPDTSAQKVAFTDDGSDANLITYDFTDPKGVNFWFGGTGGGRRLPLAYFLPIGVAGAGSAGVELIHGVEDIGLFVYGDGEGLGSREVLFADSQDFNFYFGLFYSDSGMNYFVETNVPVIFLDGFEVTGDLEIGGDIIPATDSLYDLGDSTHYWRTLYVDDIVMGDTPTIAPATAGAGVAGTTFSVRAGSGGTGNTAGGNLVSGGGDAQGTGQGGYAQLIGGGTGTGNIGGVYLGRGNLGATTANDGFIYFTSVAGNPSGTPVTAISSSIAMVYDRTNNELFAYNGAWRSVVFS